MTGKNRSEQPLRFTQNFIHNSALAKKIVDCAAIQPGETVLEIGPGKGILTHELARCVTETGRVVAVEYDQKLAETLTADVAASPQVKIEYGDILQFDLGRLPENYRVFSNVPFNITSEILETLFTGKHRPQRAHLILQTDTVMGKQYEGGALTETFKSLLLKPAYTMQSVYAFSRYDFKPSPGVNTALFAFTRREKPLINLSQYDLYKDFLAFIAKDRVGEGTWKKVFNKRQMAALVKSTGLVANKGLKMQSAEAIASLFTRFTTVDASRQAVVKGAMSLLREEQQKMEQKNQQGSHRRKRP